MKIQMAMLLVLFGLSYGVKAEGGCPTGYVPMQEQFVDPASGARQVRTNCVPGGASSEPVRPTETYKDRWGAVAIDMTVSDGGIGTAEMYPSKKAAERSALAQCRSTGGGKGCRLAATYYNQCVAFVMGGAVNAQSAATVERATELAMGKCQEKSNDCVVHYTGCSLPERVR